MTVYPQNHEIHGSQSDFDLYRKDCFRVSPISTVTAYISR